MLPNNQQWVCESVLLMLGIAKCNHPWDTTPRVGTRTHIETFDLMSVHTSITSLTITISWLRMEVPDGSSSILLPHVIQINACAEVSFIPDYKTERKDTKKCVSTRIFFRRREQLHSIRTNHKLSPEQTSRSPVSKVLGSPKYAVWVEGEVPYCTAQTPY